MGVGCFLTWVCGMPLMTSLYFSHHSAMITTAIETSDAFGHIIGPVIGSSLFRFGGFYLPFILTGSFLLLLGTISMFVLERSYHLSCQTPLVTPRGSIHAFADRIEQTADVILSESSSMSFADFISKPKIVLSILPYFTVCSLQGQGFWKIHFWTLLFQ